MGHPATKAALFHFDPADWISAHEAADRLGVHHNTLTRKCRDQLADRGLAIYQKLGSGQHGWLIHVEYHARLRESTGDPEAPDLSAYTARQQRMAWARWRCVCAFREAKRSHPGPVGRWMPAFIEQLKRGVGGPLAESHGDTFRVSRRSLYEWEAKAATIADLEALIDRRGQGRQGAGPGSESFWRYFGQLYLTDDQRTAKACFRKAADRAAVDGADAPSYQTLIRHLDEKFPPSVQAAYRTPKNYRDQVEPTGQLHPETFAVNERWESDQRTCDVRVLLPDDGKVGRPILTAWIDWRTRKCMAHRVDAYGDSETIAASLHSGLTSEENLGGPPKLVFFDNGLDFLSVAGRTRKVSAADEPRFRGTLELLGIELHLALPRGPRGKARIERWFQTKGEQLDAFLPGYCGNAPANRPESLAATEKDQSQLMTLAEYRRRVAAYIAEFNESVDHSKTDLADADGRKLSPNEAYRRWCPERRVYPQPKMLKHLLMKWGKPVPVTKQGVRIVVDGQSYYYGAANTALIPYRAAPGRRKGKGKRVFASYDPQDVGHVYLWEAIEREGKWEVGRFICTAELNHGGGVYGTEANRQQMKQVARDRRRFNRAVREYRENAPQQLMRPEERLAITAQESRADEQDGDPDPPPPIKPVPTPLDDQAGAVERAELRQAAGAETGEAAPAQRPRVNLSDAMDRMDAKGGRDRAERPRLRLSEALDKGHKA